MDGFGKSSKFVEVEGRVTGRVQGVGYRAFARNSADALGISGWVRNEPDGSVTFMAAGEQSRVNRFLDMLKKGPAFAFVEDLHISRRDYTETPPAPGFRIRF